ncbi:MAG: DNA mismatch repair protein MutL, partial [Hyphomicrobiales bacterium]|nr:DNA mismatch repair protein MutL [Hyphomicrobiales bacterium]
APTGGFAEPAQRAFAHDALPPGARAAPATQAHDAQAPLGAARAQIHGTYILAQSADGLVLVDQHAAHERLVYEKLKRQRAEGGVERQVLLIPVVVDLPAPDAARVTAAATQLAELGLVVEAFGPGAVAVAEAPQLVKGGDLAALVRDLAAALAEEDEADPLERRLDHRLATVACHNSVRAGRALAPEEMNALLREMEATPGAGQCNHGRPTYVELKLADIERLFARR